ncbi:aminoacyl-tRNA hydrolase [Anaerotignum sp.]|uniref:aminoacyl-tRNA hydrolase n=1 Tax=Anaerotignum sp. TaxID=2039241 RepID=UPI0027151333|nr:aminoacyl-tRNA hydrolase [Anaerotignum sp.]
MGLFDKFKKNDKGQDFFVIAGLGNPGPKYAGTKHNVGFDVLDRLGKKYNIEIDKFKHKALVGDGMIEGKRVLLVKPQTFMNLSGESIREIVNFYKVPQDHFVVIYDDTSLPVSGVRIREKGSHGGHNGIRNMIAQMGTDEFWRIKVGIGEKPNGWDLADYVLAKFDKDDLPMIEQGADKAVKAVELILSRGIMDAMNQTNQKAKAPKKEKNEKTAEVKDEKKPQGEVKG